MTRQKSVYIGTDSGATTSKTGGVWEDGATITTQLAQSPTSAKGGREAVISGWMQGISTFLEQNRLEWVQVQGVGLAIPGPYLRYGVLGRSPNLPDDFEGWDFYAQYAAALADKAGRAVPLTVGNDGNFGGVAEAHRMQSSGSVLMLVPGSGLGCSFVDEAGKVLDGDTLSGMESGHAPAALHLLGAPFFPCGCGRDWGCVEAYTTISGLPHLLAWKLKGYPGHPLASDTRPDKQKVLDLRTLAQQGDALALDIFDFQARALGLHVATLATTLDPKYVVIGGGLMDPEATTVEFRNRYLSILKDSAMPYLWPVQQASLTVLPAALGDLSQAIGAALVALYAGRA